MGDNGSEVRVVLEIAVDKVGNIYVKTALKTKQLAVNLLADAMKIVAMQKDNVVQISNPAEFGNRLKSFLNRKK